MEGYRLVEGGKELSKALVCSDADRSDAGHSGDLLYPVLSEG